MLTVIEKRRCEYLILYPANLNLLGISASGNYTQNWIIKRYNYSLKIVASFTI